MSPLLRVLSSGWKPCFRFPMVHNHGYKTVNYAVSFMINRRLFVQRRMPELVYLQSSRTIVLSSSRNNLRNEQDRIKREQRQQNVLLVNETGTNLGEKSLGEAIDIAREKSMELVWINKNNKTGAMPVYKMMRKISQKALKSFKTKNIELSDRIEPRDLNFKVNQIQKWLEKGHDVRVCVKSRGKGDQEEKWKIIKNVEQGVEEMGVPIARPKEDTPLQVSCTFTQSKSKSDEL